MEPISAMSSVVGIIGIAGQLTSYLSNFITTANRAPALAQHAFSEITNLSMMFSQLQGFLANQQPSQSRAMITVDELVVILTGCSVIFLELEEELRGLGNSKEMGVWEAVKWARKESTLKSLFDQLGVHKATLNLLLTILLCKSNVRADHSVSEMRSEMKKLKETNERERLEALHEKRNPPKSARESHREPDPVGFEFDNALKNTKVYNGNSKTTGTSSIFSRGRTIRSIWTQQTSLSLAEVDSVADILLPLCFSDISEGSAWFDVHTNGEIFHEPTLSPNSKTKPLIVTRENKRNTVDFFTRRNRRRMTVTVFGCTNSGKSELFQQGGRHTLGCETYTTTILSDNMDVSVIDTGCDDPCYKVFRGGEYELNFTSAIRSSDCFLLLYRPDKQYSFNYLGCYISTIRYFKKTTDPHMCPILILQSRSRSEDGSLAMSDTEINSLTEEHRELATMSGCFFMTGDTQNTGLGREVLGRLALQRMAAQAMNQRLVRRYSRLVGK